MKLTPEEVESIIRYQVGALTGFLDKYEMPLNHIKPHGSLYGMLARDEALMQGAGKDPYVNGGDTSEVGQTSGLIEIMKQCTEVRSDIAGTLTRFEIEDF